MAALTSYAPLVGGLKSLSYDQGWSRGGRFRQHARTTRPIPAVPLNNEKVKPLRKDIGELTSDASLPPYRFIIPGVDEAGDDIPIQDEDAAFLLDFESPFLESVTDTRSPSDAVFRERAVYWDLEPARAAYGRVLYRQGAFFVNRRQDAGLGTALDGFW